MLLRYFSTYYCYYYLCHTYLTLLKKATLNIHCKDTNYYQYRYLCGKSCC